MPVTALKPYVGTARDTVSRFNGNQLLYVSWDHHLLFASPFLLCVAPAMTFRQLVEGPLTALIKPDPDSAGVEWTQVRWRKSNQPWEPDFDKSLADNGLAHKEQIRFETAVCTLP